MKRAKVLGNNKGFTLIELMVVVVIIGILAAIAIPQFTKQTDKAKVKSAVSDIRNMKNIIDMYTLENENTPPTIAELPTVLSNGGISGWGDGVDAGTLEDPWGNGYNYSVDNAVTPTTYMLISYGTDGALGGSNDIYATFEDEVADGQTVAALETGADSDSDNAPEAE